MVRFRGGVPQEAQSLLDEFSETHGVKIVSETSSGYSERDLEEAIPRVHYALYCKEGVDDAGTSAVEGVIKSTVQLAIDAADSLMDELRHIAQTALRSGAHGGLSVVVQEWPRSKGPMNPERDPHGPKGKVCDDYAP